MHLPKILKAALALEKFNHESLMKLHKLADSHNDMSLTDYLEEKFLEEQVGFLQKNQ